MAKLECPPYFSKMAPVDFWNEIWIHRDFYRGLASLSCRLRQRYRFSISNNNVRGKLMEAREIVTLANVGC